MDRVHTRSLGGKQRFQQNQKKIETIKNEKKPDWPACARIRGRTKQITSREKGRRRWDRQKKCAHVG